MGGMITFYTISIDLELFEHVRLLMLTMIA